MTAADLAAFAQIEAEDNVADQNHQNQNLDCKGTKRTGNVKFQGTKEHWMLQLDYVSKNPTYGESEFAIPGSSLTNPSNRGYADIVNTQNGNIWEIKPDNPTGQISGLTEATNYVLKANQNCTSTLPIGTAWKLGTNYTPTYLPTAIPNRYLFASQFTSGVITYNYVNLSMPPVAIPFEIPQGVLDKMKHLVERLRNNYNTANKIISEYLKAPENAILLNFIKTKAIEAGVAIIVATILEDIVTLGAGIADDWVSFVLAYKIVRFGLII